MGYTKGLCIEGKSRTFVAWALASRKHVLSCTYRMTGCGGKGGNGFNIYVQIACCMYVLYVTYDIAVFEYQTSVYTEIGISIRERNLIYKIK